jgi:hypothetical protein
MQAQMLTLQFSTFCLCGFGNRPALQGRRPGGNASRRSEERRRGRKGVRPKARARSAGRERAEEASDH